MSRSGQSTQNGLHCSNFGFVAVWLAWATEIISAGNQCFWMAGPRWLREERIWESKRKFQKEEPRSQKTELKSDKGTLMTLLRQGKRGLARQRRTENSRRPEAVGYIWNLKWMQKITPLDSRGKVELHWNFAVLPKPARMSPQNPTEATLSHT